MLHLYCKRPNLFDFQEHCHFKVHCVISSLYLLFHAILLSNSRFYPIFNKLASDSLRLHHQLYKSSASVEKSRNSWFFLLLPLLFNTLESTWEPTSISPLEIGKRKVASFATFSSKTCEELPQCEEKPELTSSNSRQLVQLQSPIIQTKHWSWCW